MIAVLALARRPVLLAAAVLSLSLIAWLSPPPDRVTDRDVYEATAARGIVPDCADLHCFRVLVPWLLGEVPGPSTAKWKAYAVVSNGVAALAVFELAVLFGLSRRASVWAACFSAFGFGGLYTLHDPYTSDPLMYALGPVVTLALLQERVVVAGAVASIGVLAKEFVAAPLYIVAAAAWLERRWAFGWRALAAANTAFLVWLALQLTLIIRFNYGYGDNPSTHLLSGGYLATWVSQQSSQGVAAAMLNEFGALWILAPVGLIVAPPQLRRLAAVSVPVALLFGYVQQPDRALWNFHFLVAPLAALTVVRMPAPIAVVMTAAFVLANLRVGAQLPFVPAARFPLGLSLVLAVVGVAVAWRRGGFWSADAPAPVLA